MGSSGLAITSEEPTYLQQNGGVAPAAESILAVPVDPASFVGFFIRQLHRHRVLTPGAQADLLWGDQHSRRWLRCSVGSNSRGADCSAAR